MKSFLVAVIALLTLCGAAQAQGYSTPAEQRYSPYTADLTPCDDPGVLSTISQPVRAQGSGILEFDAADRRL